MAENEIPTLENIRQQAADLEIDVSIEGGFLSMQKRGNRDPRFDSFQSYDDPRVLIEAQNWLSRYRTFVTQADQARK